MRSTRALSGVLALSAWLLCSAAASESSGVTLLKTGAPLPRFDLLRPGVHRYVRYTVKGTTRTAIDIWTRRIAFERRDGRRRVHIIQHWDEVGRPVTLDQDSWFAAGTFVPITHVRTVHRDGKVAIGGYRFLADRIVGMDDLAGNARKDFHMASPEPAYNFEYDMELLQTLPLAPGYAASIVFYDAGIDPKPDRYVFRVAGSGRIDGPDGRPLECWIVTADYNTGKVETTFWLDKRTQTIIREESAPKPDGTYLVKALLPPEAGDIPAP